MSQRRVLVLDADESTRMLFHRTLSEEWHVVDCASQTEAATEMASMPVDVLVVEPTSLDDTAWTFLEGARASEVPFIICSTLDARRQGVQVGAFAYLIKPASPHQLAVVISDLLDQHSRTSLAGGGDLPPTDPASPASNSLENLAS